MYLFVFLLFSFTSPTSSTPFAYGAVIDAGSSGSRITVFRWDARIFPSVPPPITTVVEVVVNSARGVAGIDTPSGRAALPSLVAWAASQLAELGVPSPSAVPLFLKATAGMRMLTEEARVAAMTEVRALLRGTGFLFRDAWARVISGEEEGVAGWLSVNYLAGLLPGQPGASGATLGALDLGGASTQITFSPAAGVSILSSQFDIRLTAAASTSVYTHSFLYYGQNEAIRRINELVVLATPNASAGAIIPHPCFLLGAPLLPFNSSVAGGGVLFNGTSTPAECDAFVAPMMLKGEQCLTDPRPAAALGGLQAAAVPVPALPVINANASGSTCSVGGQYQAPLDTTTRFVAFSGFSYVYEALGVAAAAPLADLRAAASKFCAQSYGAAGAAFPGAAGPFLFNYCILGTYAVTLLTVGYGLNSSQAGLVTAAPSRASAPISWALGAMLYEANGLPWALPEPVQPGVPPSTTALAVVLGLLLGGGAAAAAWRWGACAQCTRSWWKRGAGGGESCPPQAFTCSTTPWVGNRVGASVH